jgi:hypothetical protein
MSRRFNVYISPLNGESKSKINTLDGQSIGSLVSRLYPGNVNPGVTKFYGHESGLSYNPTDTQETINGYIEIDENVTLTPIYHMLLRAGEIKPGEINLKIYVIFNPPQIRANAGIASTAQRVRRTMRTVYGTKKKRKSKKTSTKRRKTKKRSKKRKRKNKRR